MVDINKLEKIKKEIIESNDARIRKETQGMIAGVCFVIMFGIFTVLILIQLAK